MKGIFPFSFWALILLMLVLLLYASYLALDGPLTARANENATQGMPVAFHAVHYGTSAVIIDPTVTGSSSIRTLHKTTGSSLVLDRSLSLADDLDIIGQCESGGDYTLNTGNGFYGKYQFSLETWQAVSGEGYPHLASPQEQDARAGYLLTHYGAGQWPVCGRLLQ